MLTSSYELKLIEGVIFDVLADGIHLHILLEEHVCQEDNLFKIVSENSHPSIKTILVRRELMWEIKILDSVLKMNKLEGFTFYCPACTAQQF